MLADYVADCEHARERGDMMRVAALKTLSNPLAGVFTDILFVPKSWFAGSMLPASGARLLADCKGNHLQVRESARALKLALTDVLRLARDPHFHAIRGYGISRSNARVTATSCDIGTGYVRSLAQACSMSSWTFGEKNVLRIQAAFVPAEYVNRSCFPGQTPAPVVPTQVKPRR